jgi:L-ribulose-5-phosphate 4-epimerase
VTDIEQLKEKVYQSNMDLYNSNLVIGTFGNVSGRDKKSGLVAIKPSGVDYRELKAGDIVVLNLEGGIVEGDLNPSSDTKTHLELYKAFSDIGGIVHTHSTYATAWAQANRPVPCLGTTHADYFYGEVPVTDVISDSAIKKDYEQETGSLIIDTFRSIDYHHMKAVLVACHGPFTWGVDAAEAVSLSVTLEEISKTSFFSVTLNPSIKNIQKSLLDKHYLRKHGPGAYYGQDGNKTRSKNE